MVPSNTQSVRAGILGGGFMATVHSRAIRSSGGEVVAVASSSPERSRTAAQTVGAQRTDTVESLINAPDIDVIHVCTPNGLHAQHALSALAAGKHVVCEKPLATNSTDAQAMLQALHDAGTVGAVPFVYRYHPLVSEAKARIVSGDIGKVLSLDCGYLQDWLLSISDANWRTQRSAGGNSRAFADIGSHLFDLVEFVTNQRVVRLVSQTRTVFNKRGGEKVVNEDIAGVLFELDGGAVGTALISQMAPGRKNALTLEIHGSESSVRFDQEQPETLWVGGRNQSTTVFRDPDTNASGAARLSIVPAGHPMGYQDAFNAFVSDVYTTTDGSTYPAVESILPTFEDGLRSVMLTEAVLSSAQSGSWIDVLPQTASLTQTP